MEKVKMMECACCGSAAYGQQWWNRDRGYGVCRSCVDWIRSRTSDSPNCEAHIYNDYGKEGVHWGCAPDTKKEVSNEV